MAHTRARIRFTEPDGSVRQCVIEFPLKTGDEAFRFLEEFERKCGGPIPQPKRDMRWDALMKAREPQKPAAPKRRKR